MGNYRWALPLTLALLACPQAEPPADGPAIADLTSPPVPVDAAMEPCLPRVSGDLLARVRGAAFATRDGTAKMSIFSPDSATWQAARQAAISWARGDCATFAQAALQMGYRAEDLLDTQTGRRHWLLEDASGSYGGIFVFRAPLERGAARPLVIDSPHLGFDFTDDRAIVAYRDLDAVAFLQNTAHRCNLPDLSGCSAVSNYACGDGGVRTSDVVHSVNQLYYAVYDGLEEARDDLHVEYHGAGVSANEAGCAGTAHLSQASSLKLTAAQDDGTFPARFWQALERRLGAGCACYHQRESGCSLNGAASTPGRRTNGEVTGARNVCTEAATSLAGRFVHLEQYNVGVDVVIAALSEAVPK